MTLLDIIKDALVTIGALDPIDPLNDGQSEQCLRMLNRMLGFWSTQNLLIQADVTQVVTLVSGTDTYTIGTNGDLDYLRPTQLKQATFLNYDQDVSICGQQEMEQLRAISSSGLPFKATYVPGYPLGTIIFYPCPDSAYVTTLIYSSAFTEVTTDTWLSETGTDLNFEPGYDEAILWNLAERLGPTFSSAPNPIISKNAADSLRKIKALNAARKVEAVDLGISSLSTKYSRPFNIQSG